MRINLILVAALISGCYLPQGGYYTRPDTIIVIERPTQNQSDNTQLQRRYDYYNEVLSR